MVDVEHYSDVRGLVPNSDGEFWCCFLLALCFGVFACVPAMCCKFSPKARIGALVGMAIVLFVILPLRLISVILTCRYDCWKL